MRLLGNNRRSQRSVQIIILVSIITFIAILYPNISTLRYMLREDQTRISTQLHVSCIDLDPEAHLENITKVEKDPAPYNETFHLGTDGNQTTQHHRCEHTHEDDNDVTLDNVLQSMNRLSWEEQTSIFDTVNGREFPFPLTCPKRVLDSTNYTVVVAYHVGMINNWLDIVRDQMHTLDSCGLGNILTQMFVTYSRNDTQHTLEQLQSILSRYSFSQYVTYQYSPGMPFEGTALNMLRDHCISQGQGQGQPEADIIAFYFHTKGPSHYSPDWKDPKIMQVPWTYSRVLYWRKFMEYFLIERPEICIQRIRKEGAQACGVSYNHMGDESHFAGNFWSSSCKYIRTLPSLYIGSLNDTHLYHKGEFWISSNPDVYNRSLIVDLHTPKLGRLYRNLIEPQEYSDYSFRWGL